jgi:hypothetical protein
MLAITKCGGRTPRSINDILISSNLMKLGILNGLFENVLVSSLDCRSVIFHPLRDLCKKEKEKKHTTTCVYIA